MPGRWRKLHIEELHDLHFSPNIIRIMKSWTTLPPSVSRLCRHVMHNISQPYRLPRPVTGIALFIYLLFISRFSSSHASQP
jgi:hypothetical protein